MNRSQLSRLLLVFAMVPLLLLPMCGRADDSVWQDVAMGAALSRSGGEPIYYRPLRADAVLLKSELNAAPREFTSSQGTVLSLPMPDGTMQRFDVVESPIMEPGLAQRYPEIHTYRVVGIDDPQITGRLDMTPQGFHAMLSAPSGAVFIDPESGGSYYRSYRKSDYANAVQRSESERMVCLVDGSGSADQSAEVGARAVLARTGDQLRTYRLAIAATGEYTAYFGGTKPNALSAIVTAINRVNEIYERDLAIHLDLVATEDNVIYTDAATDPYDNNSAADIINNSQSDLDTNIGSGNYDIGHVFSTGSGGLAVLGVVCGVSKARGTTGLSNPTGDPFYIDYVAHEMGHQFHAEHTFNGTTGSCIGNRYSSTAYEPGSGSTIMAYAGICGSENLQSNSDATFHAGSIAEIESFVTTGSGAACGSTSPTGNSPPTVNAGGDYTIPSQTPFAVSAGSGTTDPDGDTLTYQWDEMDVGTETDSSTFGSDLGDNPLFRSFLPKSVSGRHFPRFGYQLTGASSIGETLPSTSRTLNFRLTARDGRDGVDKDDMTVTVDGGSGPFKVTAPNGGESLTALSGAVNVTWGVAGTAAAPVSCASVNIELLTFDSGHTSYCSHTLATGTPNDGSQSGLTVGVANNDHARIRISCNNNIFYDVSDADITVSGAATSEPTNCTSIDEVPPISSGGNTGGGGGGGGSFGLWSLALLSVVFGLHYRFSARRSV